MKQPRIAKILILASLAAFSSPSFAEPSSESRPTFQRLILELDSSSLNAHFTRTDTYASQFGPVRETTKPSDSFNESLKAAKNAIKRMTSLKYGKDEKVRARLGEKSITIRYTRFL